MELRALFPQTPLTLLALLSCGENNLQAKCAAKFLLDLHNERQYAMFSWAIALPQSN